MLRLAMWSGPRNISTAMMRSWGNRPDTLVCDEPLYAHYLTHVDPGHPGREEVIASGETDWRRVTRWLTDLAPEGKTIFYQKHMAHHLLPHMERDWLSKLVNCFLIREPKEMLASLDAKMGTPVLRDTGLEQQAEIFRSICQGTGRSPAVIDSADVLRDPRRVLGALCESVGAPFTDAMLTWPPGRRDTDGIWAKYWYDAVERSTGFEPYRERSVTLPSRLLPLYEECRKYYEELYRGRIH